MRKSEAHLATPAPATRPSSSLSYDPIFTTELESSLEDEAAVQEEADPAFSAASRMTSPTLAEPRASVLHVARILAAVLLPGFLAVAASVVACYGDVPGPQGPLPSPMREVPPQGPAPGPIVPGPMPAPHVLPTLDGGLPVPAPPPQSGAPAAAASTTQGIARSPARLLIPVRTPRANIANTDHANASLTNTDHASASLKNSDHASASLTNTDRVSDKPFSDPPPPTQPPQQTPPKLPPPVDAGVDSTADLPPELPDAAPTVTPDAGQPL